MPSNKLGSRIIARLAWLAIGAGSGAYVMSHGLVSQHQARSFLGFGLILFGVLWFLQPLSLAGQLGRLDARSKASAIGPAGLRALIALAAFACVVAGIVLYVSGSGWLATTP